MLKLDPERIVRMSKEVPEIGWGDSR